MKLIATLCFIVNLLTALNALQKVQGVETGQKIFAQNCVKCHGRNGKRGFLGAKNLAKSRLTTEQSKKIILTGKGFMPAWQEQLTEAQIEKVIEYISTLRE